MAKKIHLILVALAVSLSFNAAFIAFQNSVTHTPSSWSFSDLGPALMQDSYSNRAPALESPFGMIGDIPGGYPLYVGCPLQSNPPETLSPWIPSCDFGAWNLLTENIEMLLTALLISLIPLLVILVLGRKSFGSAKTQ